MNMRIAIIGAGKRVRNTVIPAIWALGPAATLVAVHSRKPHDISLPDGRVMTSRTEIGSLAVEEIDLLIVAVGTNAIRGVLESVARKSGRERIVLMMDTPPTRLSDILKRAQFRGYRQVCVGEDWVRLTPVLAIRDMIARGDIGTLRSIRLDHLGYRYHGVATLRALSGSRAVTSMRRRPLGGDKAEIRFNLGRGTTATTIEPRNYNTGRMVVTGSAGTIGWSMGDDLIDCDIRIGCPETGTGWFQPTEVNGTMQAPDPVEEVMAGQSLGYLEDTTRMNLLKIRGYARLIEDLLHGRQAYPIGEGLYDYLAVSMAEMTGRFVDPPLGGSGKGVVRRLLDVHG